jgi:hypothetical protein
VSDRTTPGDRITRDDIEERFRSLQGDVNERVDDSRGRAVQIAVAAGVAVVVVAFLLGRRRGRRRTTLVEIRRL